jgi:hypothetical protein
VYGLLADLPPKNCWTIAEHAGDTSPDGMQHLLGRAVWDQDGVRDDVRAYLVEALAAGTASHPKACRDPQLERITSPPTVGRDLQERWVA